MVALGTFKNLSAERQQKIILVALKEFALNEYQIASLSTIIDHLGLAKGSFYRYFKNKQSLYFYLLDTCINARIENDKKFITVPSSDFFELLVQHLVAKIHFDKSFPLHSAFLHNVIQERNNDELGEIQFKSKNAAIKIIKETILAHLKKGRIRKDVDVDTVSFFVFKTQISITEFLGFKHKIDFNKRIRQQKPLYDIDEKEILAVSRSFAELLKNGISLGINNQRSAGDKTLEITDTIPLLLFNKSSRVERKIPIISYGANKLADLLCRLNKTKRHQIMERLKDFIRVAF